MNCRDNGINDITNPDRLSRYRSDMSARQRHYPKGFEKECEEGQMLIALPEDRRGFYHRWRDRGPQYYLTREMLPVDIARFFYRDLGRVQRTQVNDPFSS